MGPHVDATAGDIQGAEERQRLGTRTGHPEVAPVLRDMMVSVMKPCELRSDARGLARALITDALAAHMGEVSPGMAPMQHVGLP